MGIKLHCTDCFGEASSQPIQPPPISSHDFDPSQVFDRREGNTDVRFCVNMFGLNERGVAVGPTAPTFLNVPVTSQFVQVPSVVTAPPHTSSPGFNLTFPVQSKVVPSEGLDSITNFGGSPGTPDALITCQSQDVIQPGTVFCEITWALSTFLDSVNTPLLIQAISTDGLNSGPITPTDPTMGYSGGVPTGVTVIDANGLLGPGQAGTTPYINAASGGSWNNLNAFLISVDLATVLGASKPCYIQISSSMYNSLGIWTTDDNFAFLPCAPNLPKT